MLGPGFEVGHLEFLSDLEIDYGGSRAHTRTAYNLS